MKMTTTSTERRQQQPGSEIVLEVPREDELSYSRHSYHDLMHVWNELVSELAVARQTGDATSETRVHDELHHFWPHAADLEDASWVPDDEREHALPSNDD